MLLGFSIAIPVGWSWFLWKSYKENQKQRKLKMLNYIVNGSNNLNKHRHIDRNFEHNVNARHFSTTTPIGK